MKSASQRKIPGPERRDAPATSRVMTSPGARYGGVAAVMLAFLLLLAFYFTVAAAVHQADLRRHNARLEIDRQAACGAPADEAERARCAVRFAQRGMDGARAAVVAPEQPSNELLSTTWRERHVIARRPHRTAGLY